MKTHYSNQYLFCASFAAAALMFAYAASASATPSDDIRRAVATAGASDVKKADEPTFIKGFTVAATHVRGRQMPSYVTAAMEMRPDLAGPIVVAAIRVARPIGGKEVVDKQLSCESVEPIIRAAIAAAPDAKDAIVRAAIAADPWARECILAGAGMKSETETAFFRPPGVDAGNINSTTIGTINPGNIGVGGAGNVQSPNQPKP